MTDQTLTFTAKGGKVLGRAVKAALNLIPGPVGRYEVVRSGPTTSVLCERLPEGLGPLVVFGVGVVYVPRIALVWELLQKMYHGAYYEISTVAGFPTLAQLQEGWPFKRHLAILRLAARALPGGGPYKFTTATASLTNRLGEVVTPNNLSLAGQYFLVTGPQYLATECVRGRDAAVNRTARKEFERVSASIGDFLHDCVYQTSRLRLAKDAQKALSSGFTVTGGLGEREAPAGALSEISQRPELWSADTDPGGDGTEAGPEDGRRVNMDWEDEGCEHCNGGCSDCQDAGECCQCGRSL